MVGYTVNTGSSEEFAEGWDRVFSKKKAAKKKKAVKKKAVKKKASKKAAKKKKKK